MMRVYATVLALLLALTSAGCETVDSAPYEDDVETDVYSFALTLHYSDLVHNGFVASRAWDRVDIPLSTVRNGAVVAYYYDEGTWTALPTTLGLEKPDEPLVDYTVTFGYAFEEDFFELYLEASTDDPLIWNADPEDDIVQIAEIFGGATDIKVVVIDSYVPMRRSVVDLSDYEAVRDYYGLEE